MDTAAGGLRVTPTTQVNKCSSCLLLSVLYEQCKQCCNKLTISRSSFFVHQEEEKGFSCILKTSVLYFVIF